ncbi:MAG: thermonuclease family protein [Pseudomonadota bacterium]
MDLLALPFTVAVFGLVSTNTVATAATDTPSVLMGEVRATDGDSLRMGDHRIRLFGIDAPESAQTCDLNGDSWACGRASRKALERLVKGETVHCVTRDMDRGRHVAICTAGEIDLSAHMVERGWAVAFTRYSFRYASQELTARRAGRALWRSDFERPAAYRARLRKEQAEAAASNPQTPPDADCTIKGNVSRSGTKIAHTPGQRDYGRTRIDASSGERWFCSVTDAIEAGWRLAKR